MNIWQLIYIMADGDPVKFGLLFIGGCALLISVAAIILVCVCDKNYEIPEGINARRIK